MSTVVRGDPARLETYTRSTFEALAATGSPRFAYEDAVAMYLSATPNDFGPGPVVDRAGPIEDLVAGLARLDAQPAAFAWALRLLDRSGGAVLSTSNAALLDALVGLRLRDPDADDDDALRQALLDGTFDPGMSYDELEALAGADDPAAVRTAFDRLLPEQQLALGLLYPALVGNLDGVPPDTRYVANHERMVDRHAELRGRERAARERLEQLRSIEDDLLDPDRGPPSTPDVLMLNEIAALETELADIDEELATLDDLLAPRDDGLRRQFLVYDPDEHLAAEVFGDLEAAEHIAVVVPGTSTPLSDFESGVATKAMNLQSVMTRYDADSATVAWLGYDAPDNLAQAALPTDAIEGAPALMDHGRALDTLEPEQVTVIGHSYGSLVLGHALRDGLPVDDAVAVGSPGMGGPDWSDWNGVDDVSQLETDATVWAAKAPGDLVPLAPVHGEDPAAEGFGAERFTVAAVGGHDGIREHSSYFTANTTSLVNMALIATGLPPLGDT